MKPLLIPIVALAALLGLGIASAAPSSQAAHHSGVHTAQAPTAHVKMIKKNGVYLFSPAKITVKAGTIVIWKNASDTQHTVTEARSKWTSPTINPHKTYKRRFTTPGTYKYICAFHGSMLGTVVVKKAA